MSTPPPTSAAGLVLVTSDAFNGWVFHDAHPTQGRRFRNGRSRVLDLAASVNLSVAEVAADLLPDLAVLADVHDRGYVETVVLGGRCDEWSGVRRDLGEIALRMVGGTLLAVEALLAGSRTAVNLAGAKHHAMRANSSGFCVFNDLAIAARLVLDGHADRVSRIAILDIDAHHGDGTEVLCADDPRILTFSVHDRTIFPGTGHEDDPSRHVHNRPLAAGSGDSALASAVAQWRDVAERFAPDMIMLAIGADGHRNDPLSTLTYTYDGMSSAVAAVRQAFPELPILCGGAGGYCPDLETPESWARMAVAAAIGSPV